MVKYHSSPAPIVITSSGIQAAILFVLVIVTYPGGSILWSHLKVLIFYYFSSAVEIRFALVK